MAEAESLEVLKEFLRFPSIFTQAEHDSDVQACASWITQWFKEQGFSAETIPTTGHPVVVARLGTNPHKKTVLIYGHYDVQPPDPLNEWETAPFDPQIKDDRIYGRGSSDNKGQILAHMLGVAKLWKEEHELPVNVIFLVEGEEEIGSPSLEQFLKDQRNRLRCDVIAISDTGMISQGVPTLTYGLRGITALEFTVKGPSTDLHSGIFGGAVMNPATAAAQLIASLHDAKGRVTIEGFYNSVRPLASWEKDAMDALPDFDKELLEVTGVPALFGEEGYSAMEQIGTRPTAEVNGFGSGYQGEGTKTVLPKSAFVKLTFRLVPDQNPETILDLVEAHLQKHLPPGVTLEITRGHSGAAFLGDPTTGYGKAAAKALEATFGRPPALVREGGSIPIVEAFQRVLGVETLLLGLANPDCRAHSPNENFVIENFLKGIQLNQALLKEIGKRGDKVEA